MAACKWDTMGWRKELTESTSFIATTVQIDNGSNEVYGQTALTVDGAGGDATTEVSIGDVIYAHATADGSGIGYFTPKELGVVTGVAATEITVGAGIVNTALNNDYIHILHPNSGILQTPVRTTELTLDDAHGVTAVVDSKRFDWVVKEDFTVAFNCISVNRSDMTLNGVDDDLMNCEVIGSVNGTNWVVLQDFGDLRIDGACIAAVYDIDASGVLPYMALRTSGPDSDQGTHGDGGGPLKIKVAVIPHG